MQFSLTTAIEKEIVIIYVVIKLKLPYFLYILFYLTVCSTRQNY